MANSTRTRIIENIKTTLAAIAPAGGYNLTAGEVKRAMKQFGAVPEDVLASGKFAAYLAGADEKRRNSAQRTFSGECLVSIVGYVKTAAAADEDTGRENLESDLDKMIEDITKALFVDVSRGGYAVTTEITDIDTDKGSFHPFAAAEMLVRVEYRAGVTAP